MDFLNYPLFEYDGSIVTIANFLLFDLFTFFDMQVQPWMILSVLSLFLICRKELENTKTISEFLTIVLKSPLKIFDWTIRWLVVLGVLSLVAGIFILLEKFIFDMFGLIGGLFSAVIFLKILHILWRKITRRSRPSGFAVEAA